MKREYVRPIMVCDVFAADEYVAACGDGGVTYNFECNAGDGVYGSVWIDSNKNGALDSGDERIAKYEKFIFLESGYHACGEKHTASSTDPFYNGFYAPHGEKDKATSVVIWRGQSGKNVHCTTILDKKEWEIARS